MIVMGERFKETRKTYSISMRAFLWRKWWTIWVIIVVQLGESKTKQNGKCLFLWHKLPIGVATTVKWDLKVSRKLYNIYVMFFLHVQCTHVYTCTYASFSNIHLQLNCLYDLYMFFKAPHWRIGTDLRKYILLRLQLYSCMF